MTIEDKVRNFLNSKRNELDKDGAWTVRGTEVILGFFKVSPIVLFPPFCVLTIMGLVFIILILDDLMASEKTIILACFAFLFLMGFLIQWTNSINSKLSVYPDRFIYKGEIAYGKRTQEIRYEDITEIEVTLDSRLTLVSDGAKLQVDSEEPIYNMTIYYNQGEYGKRTFTINTGDIQDKGLFRLLRSAFRDKVYDYTDTDLSNSRSDVLNILQLDAWLIKTAGLSKMVKIDLVTDYINKNYFHRQNTSTLRESIKNKICKCLDSKQKKYQVYCSQIRKNGKMLYDEKLELLDHFFAVAYASEGVDKNELYLLHEIARFFSVNDWDVINLEYKYECRKKEQQTENQSASSPVPNIVLNKAYEMLGLKEGVSVDEIKTSYRQLAKTYHPDALSTKCSDDERESAVAKFRAITEAYEILCSKTQ